MDDWIDCGCQPWSITEYPEDVVEPVDVDAALEITARVLLKDPRPGEVNQPLFMDRVGPCGHVGRGHTWQMEWENPPVQTWFGLTQWIPHDGVATLYVCPSLNYETVQQADIDVARAMACYASEHDALPWDLAFVTMSGNFRASDLLDLPGLPPFTMCAYKKAD